MYGLKAAEAMTRCFLHGVNKICDTEASLSAPSRTARSDEGYVQLTVSDVVVEKGLQQREHDECTPKQSPVTKQRVKCLLRYLRASLDGCLVLNRQRELSDQQILAMVGLDVDGEGL